MNKVSIFALLIAAGVGTAFAAPSVRVLGGGNAAAVKPALQTSYQARSSSSGVARTAASSSTARLSIGKYMSQAAAKSGGQVVIPGTGVSSSAPGGNGNVDLTGYATETYVNHAVDDMATKTWVDDRYTTTNEVNNIIDSLKNGFVGSAGPQGAAGIKGDQGYQGNPGIQGDQGVQGLQGNQGAQGHQGDQGPQGAAGIKGDQGYQGNPGIQGDQGVQGHQGDQGPQGAAGIKGNQGYQGNPGIQGDQGVQGPQGNQGAQGNQGDQGPQGNQGKDAELPTCPTDANYVLFQDNSGKISCAKIAE